MLKIEFVITHDLVMKVIHLGFLTLYRKKNGRAKGLRYLKSVLD